MKKLPYDDFVTGIDGELWINTKRTKTKTKSNIPIGLAQANKVMHLSAIAYNLKKYLKFEGKRVKSGAEQLGLSTLLKSALVLLFVAPAGHLKLDLQY